jgi:hypothetical protein
MTNRSLALALALVAAPAAAQDVPLPVPPLAPLPLATGARLRLTQVGGGTLQGFLAGASDRALLLALPTDNPLMTAQRLEVPFASLARVEISTGRKHHLWLGAAIGAVVLGATGFSDAVAPEDCGSDSSAFCSRAEAVAISAIAGATLGGLVGFAIRTETWTPVAIEALGAAPVAGEARRPAALTAGITFRF